MRTLVLALGAIAISASNALAQDDRVDLCKIDPAGWYDVLGAPMAGTWTMTTWTIRADAMGFLEADGAPVLSTVTLTAADGAMFLSGAGFADALRLPFVSEAEWPLEDAGYVQGVGDLSPEAHELPRMPCESNAMPRLWSAGEIAAGAAAPEFDLAFYVQNRHQLLGAIFDTEYDPGASPGRVRQNLRANNQAARAARVAARQARLQERLASGTVTSEREARIQRRLERLGQIAGQLAGAGGERVITRAFLLTR